MRKPGKPKELGSSGDILQYPDGDIEEPVLRALLTEAHYAGISPKESVLVTKHMRIKGPSPRFPEYEDKQSRMTLKSLKELYKGIYGHGFEPPDISEREYLDRKNQAFVRAAARRGYTSRGD